MEAGLTIRCCVLEPEGRAGGKKDSKEGSASKADNLADQPTRTKLKKERARSRWHEVDPVKSSSETSWVAAAQTLLERRGQDPLKPMSPKKRVFVHPLTMQEMVLPPSPPRKTPAGKVKLPPLPSSCDICSPSTKSIINREGVFGSAHLIGEEVGSLGYWM